MDEETLRVHNLALLVQIVGRLSVINAKEDFVNDFADAYDASVELFRKTLRESSQ